MHLDSDTLRNILEILRLSRGLAALSMTCKWIREACKPIMFQSCNLIIPCTSYFDSSWRRRILPAAIRDYVMYVPQNPTVQIWLIDGCLRTLTIECTFHRLGPKWMLSSNASAYDKVYQPFIDALARMPKLRNITLYAAQCDGIPWEAMRAIVTIPQVRSLSFEGLFDRRSSLSRELQALPMYPLAPLERLSYTTEAYQPSPLSTEIDFFVRLFRQAELRKSLEIAEMIGHCAPLELFGGSRWSHLRVLSLHGQQFETYGVSLETPVITLLGGMPALRELTLKTAQPKASVRRYVWPPGLTASLPWPHLEIFAISNLLADDEICTHLPPSLRRLSLLCWPRHYVHRDRRGRDAMDVFGWRLPVLTSSAMLHVLCSCHTPALEQLDIEYRVDYRERDLLRLLASRFPALTMLTIHRYCDDSANEDSAVRPFAALVQHLTDCGMHSPLTQLRWQLFATCESFGWASGSRTTSDHMHTTLKSPCRPYRPTPTSSHTHSRRRWSSYAS